MKQTTCRFCKTPLGRILSLGRIPLVNYFPKKSELSREKRFPLILMLCAHCGLCQLGYIVRPRDVFQNYHYMSSVSQPLVDHLSLLAGDSVKMVDLKKNDSVLDIGANDGTLLIAFQKLGMKVYGIDPSHEAVKRAKTQGIHIEKQFFSQSFAKKLKRDKKTFDLVTATHTLANILDLHSFFMGIRLILKPNGYLILEVGSIESMVKKTEFDAIYHEHYSYFSKKSLTNILEFYGFEIKCIEENDCHGGSLRVYARLFTKPAQYTCTSLSGKERRAFIHFAKKARVFKRELKKTIAGIGGNKIIGYGAPAKSVTLLSFCGIGKRKISYIVDSTPIKQGRYLPGLHIPIYPLNILHNSDYDMVILLAWSYRDFALKFMRKFITHNVKILLPFPKLKILHIRAKRT